MYLSHSDIAHNWAHQVRNRAGEIAGNGGNMLYEGSKIYSYGKHFCIARLLPDSKTVVYGTHTYSSSTSKHQHHVRGAVSHLRTVYCYDPDRTAVYNRARAESQVKTAIEEAATPRRVQPKTRLASLAQARAIVQNFNEYLSALPEDERRGVEPLETPRIDEVKLEELKAQAKAQAAREQVAQEERERAHAHVQQSRLAEWRRHAYSGYDLPPKVALRLSSDRTEVQTTKGAHIPVSHAKRIWPIIVNCKSTGKGMRFDEGRTVSFHLGHFTLDEIRPDGSIVVGCHDIPFNEIEGIAHELGLTDTSEAQRAWDAAVGK